MSKMFRSGARLAAIVLLGSHLGGLAGSAFGQEGKSESWDKDSSIADLEQRIETIDADLSQLARWSLRSGVGSIGYRSDSFPDAAHLEWIQIDLDEEQSIDQIIVVPSLARDTREGVIADGFPVEFRIVAGKSSDPEDGEEVVASFGANDQLLPRLAPLVVPCPGLSASWIRVEASVLSPRAWDGQFELQLSEILIFNGEENVAQQKQVQTSSSGVQEGGARHRRYLVDGFMPYLMDASEGAKSIPFVSWLRDQARDPLQLTIDLGTVAPVNRIHLHSMEVNDNIPQTDPSNFGIPRRILVEGANDPSFSDAVPLVEYEMKTILDAGPIIMRHFPETACRYVRLVILDPYTESWGTHEGIIRLGFAEIELLARGKNVAQGRPVHSNVEQSDDERPLSNLTDGRNLYGEILPLRAWLNQLGRRHDLESERPLVEAELLNRYEDQKQTLSLLKWLTLALIAVVLGIIMVMQVIRQRDVLRTRQRIGADLHDELGANLHAIGLLSDLALASTGTPDRQNKLLRRLRGTTTRTINAARYCTNLLEAKNLDASLIEDIEKLSTRILADIQHKLTIDGEEFLKSIRPQQRLDLLLFYKESLVNVLRHSGATRVRTEVLGTAKEISLTITDNGQGLGNSPGSSTPASLRRRAKLMGARVSAKPSTEGGTCIRLCLRSREPWKLPWKIRS